jgi:hypothetical protein
MIARRRRQLRPKLRYLRARPIFSVPNFLFATIRSERPRAKERRLWGVMIRGGVGQRGIRTVKGSMETANYRFHVATPAPIATIPRAPLPTVP